MGDREAMPVRMHLQRPEVQAVRHPVGMVEVHHPGPCRVALQTEARFAVPGRGLPFGQ